MLTKAGGKLFLPDSKAWYAFLFRGGHAIRPVDFDPALADTCFLRFHRTIRLPPCVWAGRLKRFLQHFPKTLPSAAIGGR
jgi:hypothetical protein